MPPKPPTPRRGRTPFDPIDPIPNQKDAPKPSISKTNTIEAFIKARSKLRVGSDAIATFLASLDTLAETVTTQAEASAQAEKRNTILAKDIQASFDSQLGGSDLASLFKRLEALNAKDTVQIAKHIEDWLKGHP